MKISNCVYRLYQLWVISLVGMSLYPYKLPSNYKYLGLNVDYFFFIAIFFVINILVISANNPFKIYRQLKGSTLLFIILFLLYGALSCFWVKSLEFWLVSLGMFIFYLTSSLVMGYFFSSSVYYYNKFSKFALRAISIFVVIGILKAFVDSFHTAYLGDYSSVIDYRSSEIMIILGHLPFALSLCINRKRILNYILLSLLIVGVFLTFSRTAMVGVTVTLLIYLFFSIFTFKVFSKRVLAFWLTLAGVLVLVAPVASNTLLGKRIDAISNSLPLLFGSNDDFVIGDGDARRKMILSGPKKIISERPMVGTGLGNYMVVLRQIEDNKWLHARSHNLYLSYMAELGVIGFFLFIMIPISLLLNMVRRMTISRRDSVFFYYKLTLIAQCSVLFSLFIMFIAQEFVTAPYIWYFFGLCLAQYLILRDYCATCSNR